jgi:hypothetical protein
MRKRSFGPSIARKLTASEIYYYYSATFHLFYERKDIFGILLKQKIYTILLWYFCLLIKRLFLVEQLYFTSFMFRNYKGRTMVFVNQYASRDLDQNDLYSSFYH